MFLLFQLTIQISLAAANLEVLSAKIADDPSGETGCSTHGIDSQLVILSKVETYSFPIANETQPHRYIISRPLALAA